MDSSCHCGYPAQPDSLAGGAEYCPTERMYGLWTSGFQAVHEEQRSGELQVQVPQMWTGTSMPTVVLEETTFRMLVRIIHMWAHKSSFSAIKGVLGVGNDALSKLIFLLRSAIKEDVKKNPPELGGLGHIVEVDEAEFGNKQKCF